MEGHEQGDLIDPAAEPAPDAEPPSPGKPEDALPASPAEEPAPVVGGPVRAIAPLKRSNAGGSGSFLLRADDGRRYWCKTVNNMQDPMVPVNEQIVARLAALLGVAVPDPRLVEIPEDLAGWEFRPGRALEKGWAHGGLAVEGAIETHALEHRSSGDNAVRHAGFFALHDWLGGQDPQWVYEPKQDNRYYSHDHGHYFWGPSWTPETLAGNKSTPTPLGMETTGLDAAELARLADRLESLEREEIAAALTNFPGDWPIDDAGIAAVVDFAYDRRKSVAERLRALPT